VLGLDFGGTKIAMAVCSPDGEQLAAVTVATDAAAGARACFDRGIRSARELLAAFAPGRELAAVGVATFGIPFDDHVDLAPNVGGWGDLALGRELKAAFPGAAVRMATDAKAAALAESRWGALAGADPGIYLNLGTGLAVGIVVGGQVLQGRHGAAGEIGYNLRSVADVAAAAGPRPVLEEMVSGLGLARRAATLDGAGGAGRPAAGHRLAPSGLHYSWRSSLRRAEREHRHHADCGAAPGSGRARRTCQGRDEESWRDERSPGLRLGSEGEQLVPDLPR